MYDANALRYSLPWIVDEIERTRRLFGPDPWSYGLSANRQVLETLVAYMVEQGLLERALPVDEVFAPSVRDS